jgi:ribosomal protein S18 acetylase RimI-like enzyme
MNIRPLEPTDAKAVAALWHAGAAESGAVNPGFLPRLSAAEYAELVREELNAKVILGWCATLTTDRSLLAYLTAKLVAPSVEWQQGGHLYIVDVDVSSSVRRRGYATALLHHAANHARGLGLSRIELSWLADDPRSTSLWAKLGFRSYLHRGFLNLPDAK